MYDDFELCLRAVRSKDPRFDGWFFACVISTGIYCRASCPVVPPQARNIRFCPSAAAAQAAGFRACQRCRPDAAPGSPEWNHRADAVARAQRAQTARLLIETSSLPLADVALAAGFASIRQFNDTVRSVFAVPPTALRERAVRQSGPAAQGTLSLRLPFRAPMCPDSLFGHLVATAVPGVEEWRGGAYRRTSGCPMARGWWR